MGAMTETTVKQGRIQGIKKNDYTVFMGVPYAAPPTGNLRFRAPQECKPWEGVYHADHFGKTCWQEREEKNSFYDIEFYSDTDYLTDFDEDCLYLNIWTPASAPEEKLPVAFWIHGGAFNHGFGHEMEFDGEEYAKRGVILVTINYRVGVFGYLAHEWLSEENPQGISGNYGMLDQIAALRWVKENIGAFGGNGDNITIFGQSAGAISVQGLISSELTGNRITKAIMQSGGGYGENLLKIMPLAEAEETGKQFVEFCGLESLEQLRSISPKTLLEKQSVFCGQRQRQGLIFTPNIDGYVLKESYNSCVEKGKIKKIPYMIGSTLNDIATSPEQLSKGVRGLLYDGCVRFAQMVEKSGTEGAGAPAVYVYDFQRRLPGDEAGAFHSAELWYMFGTCKRCWRPLGEADVKLSEEMLDAWTGFMKKGMPGGEWEPYTEKNPFVREFDVKEQHYSYREFFKNLYKNTEKICTFQAKTPEEAKQWQEELRRAIRKTLGIDELERIFAEWQDRGKGTVRLIENVKEDGYLRRKYLLETLPEVYMPFYMLIPDKISEQNPGKGMIAIPAHGANKEVVAGVPANEAVREKLKRTPKEAYGLTFVKKGYVVFCPDPPGYGERMEPIAFEESAFTPDFRQDPLGCSCKNLALTAEALGLSLMGLEIWDLLRLLEFSSECPEVDPEKMGCAGFSGGGQYTMWLAALDDRVKTAVVSGYVHGYLDSILDVHLCSCNYAPGLWKLGDISDFCSLIAPRPLFVENGTQDPENGYRGITGPKEQVEKIRKAYEVYGKEENLRHVTPEGTHLWYGECFDFVEKHL